ncbi:restriction endonuclease [Rodentibacter haemolyticus]|uniref:restriction endonuclease n=1 Tax=Rodentibacter haemolyticus TaxID=2778911 RepID=UPI0038CD7293
MAEPKGSSEENQLRTTERHKIDSAKRFFKALNQETTDPKVRYGVVSEFGEVEKRDKDKIYSPLT